MIMIIIDHHLIIFLDHIFVWWWQQWLIILDYISRSADEELWDDGSFPHNMQRMTMKYGEGIISWLLFRCGDDDRWKSLGHSLLVDDDNIDIDDDESAIDDDIVDDWCWS